MTPLENLLAAAARILLLILLRDWMHARSLQRALDEAEKRYWLKWGRRDFYGEMPASPSDNSDVEETTEKR